MGSSVARYAIVSLLVAARCAAALDSGVDAEPALAPWPVAVVAVRVPDAAAIDALAESGCVIGNVRGDTATVYVPVRDLERLTALGYPMEIIEWQHPSVTTRPAAGAKALGQYHSYATMTALLETYAAAYPEICRLFSAGASYQGRELWVLRITANPDVEEDEPEFKYISTMHGDEPLGTELCLYLIDRLLAGYGADTRITDLVDTTAISIMPLMNPDGLEASTRYDFLGNDMNRSFPIYGMDFTGTLYDGAPLDFGGRPVEVGHVMQWTADNSFVLSANFHTGALVVNYPYDDDGIPSGTDAPTADDLLFEEIAWRYTYHNPPMWSNDDPANGYFNGIINGNMWYRIQGGMQDWNYRYASCNEVTIEVSRNKKPAESSIPDFWAENEESMLAYLESAHMGVRGLVTDSSDGAPVWAQVEVVGNSHPVFTDPDVGDYHRMLLPGAYTLRYYAPAYVPETVEDIVVADGPATRADVSLINADVDDDGAATAVDVQLIVRAVLGLPSADAPDLDGNGVSSTDIVLAIRAALQIP